MDVTTPADDLEAQKNLVPLETEAVPKKRRRTSSSKGTDEFYCQVVLIATTVCDIHQTSFSAL